MSRILRCGERSLLLDHVLVMGVLNLTPDSFSDGGELLIDAAPAGRDLDADALLRRAEQMVSAGAEILDLGAESTRPGAAPVTPAIELERICTALDLLAPRIDAVFSIDSSTPEVFTAAAAAGAGLLNDVRALQREGALEAAAATGLPVSLMHMQGTPATMQEAPSYGDVVAEVAAFLRLRVEAAQGAGIGRERLLVDPGFGFGKSLAHNLTLLRRLPELAALDLPLLVGLSRKRMIGTLTGRPPGDRVSGSIAAAALAVAGGAAVVRTHDVAQTVDAVRVAEAMVAAQ